MRADQKLHVPVVLTSEEVAAILSRMGGTAQVVPLSSTGADGAAWKPSGSGART
jgi:hypothetical protein